MLRPSKSLSGEESKQAFGEASLRSLNNFEDFKVRFSLKSRKEIVKSWRVTISENRSTDESILEESDKDVRKLAEEWDKAASKLEDAQDNIDHAKEEWL